MGSDRKGSGMTIVMIDMNGWMKTSRLKKQFESSGLSNK